MDNENNTVEANKNEELQYTNELIDLLYQSASETMKIANSLDEEIPSSGNLGLLAAGYRGVISWRKKREKEFGKRLYSPILERVKELQKNKEA